MTTMDAGQAPETTPGSSSIIDYAAYLRQQLAQQQFNVASYRLGDEQVWLKKAGAPHGMGRYRAMAALAALLRLEVLRPVPNRGGNEAIATEVRRLRDLQARGLRVPTVLAAQEDGFLMRHLGRPAQQTPSLGNEIDHAVSAGPAAVLALWQQGLVAIAQVHAAGTCLSQAFARNLVRCPDGVVGYIDFEDDPAGVLPLPVCHARDALCYAHSTAIYLRLVGALDDARALWAAWVAAGSPELQAVMASSVGRMGWMRHLPQSRKLGRDMQRVRAAYDLLGP
jgi:hypothetical protein